MLQNDVETSDTKECWSYFMNLLRWVLHPHDVVEAIVAQAWRADSTFAADQHIFTIIRGTFDYGVSDLSDWDRYRQRASCIAGLGVKDKESLRDEDERSWWDQCRMQHGSPFHLDFDWNALVH